MAFVPKTKGWRPYVFASLAGLSFFIEHTKVENRYSVFNVQHKALPCTLTLILYHIYIKLSKKNDIAFAHKEYKLLKIIAAINSLN